MKTVSLTIDGQPITAPEGRSLLWVALDNGIYIPNLCALRDKSEPAAACRLCFVEVAGEKQPVTACTEPVRAGMVANTRGERALKLARTGLELLLASHPVDCTHCPANRACELQKIARHLGVKLNTKHFRKLQRDLPIDDSHPRFIYDPNKCVLCGRCIWVCQRHKGKNSLGLAHRGFQRRVTTFADEPMSTINCGDCYDCVAVCPTGALVPRHGKKAPALT